MKNDASLNLENVYEMNIVDIVSFRLRCAIKFLIATIEMFMASAIASGSQSDIVNYFVCFFYA